MLFVAADKLDYGAQYIHGCKNNPVYDIAAARGLIEEKSCTSDDSDNQFYTQNGRVIPDAVAREVCSILDGILEDGSKFASCNIPVGAEESVGIFLHTKFQQYLQSCADPDHVHSMKEAVYNWRLLQEKTDNACRSVFELSLYAWGQYLPCPGARYMQLKTGFGRVIDAIMEDIPPHLIHLKSPVKRIIWASDSDDCIRVVTCDGEVLADHVIVTCSLGVLQHHAHKLFQPLLPSNKLAVISRMGFGTVDKIYLQF